MEHKIAYGICRGNSYLGIELSYRVNTDGRSIAIKKIMVDDAPYDFTVAPNHIKHHFLAIAYKDLWERKYESATETAYEEMVHDHLRQQPETAINIAAAEQQARKNPMWRDGR